MDVRGECVWGWRKGRNLEDAEAVVERGNGSNLPRFKYAISWKQRHKIQE
jgi:hypothetical protein